MWRRWHQDEDGIALVFAMLAVIIVGGVATVMLVRAASQNSATRHERDFEQAVHTAEAALDDVITDLNLNQAYLTEDPATSSPHVYDIALDASEDTQRSWALAIAQSKCALVPTGEGEACGIRPKLPDSDGGEALPWLYGVSFVPNRANPESVRVIKMQFDEGFFSPPKAILTQGDLTLGGSLSIGGANGSVHTNGSVTVNGGAVTTTGPVTSTGTFTGGCSGCATGSGQIADTIDVPKVSAIAAYRREAGQYAGKFDSTTGDYGGEWFDLCSDGTVQVPTFAGSAPPVPAPCSALPPSNRILYDAKAPDAPARFNGWSWSASKNTWSAGGGGNNNVADQLRNGVYYVHEANADISGSVATEVLITILVDAVGVNDPTLNQDTSCQSSGGGESGNLSITGVGQGVFRSFLADLLFLTDRDTSTTGNMQGTTLGGVIATHEQLNIGGTPTVEGAVAAEDACDTPTSPVHKNAVDGNFTLSYEGLGSVPLSSVVRITAWNELS